MQENAQNQDDSQMHQLLSDPDFITPLRQQMVRFATQQLSVPTAAEDAVQEAFVGAFRNASSFQGKAALKSWVFAILKNKIADTLRQKQRYVEASRLQKDQEEELDFSELFNQRGYWPRDEHPHAWSEPDAVLKDQHFWRIFEVCLDNLPGNQGRAFMMREFIELESNEICDAMAVTESNLNVMLYRARMRLRECLTINWFVSEEGSSC